MASSQNFNPPGHDPLAPTYSHISRVPISSTHTLVSLAGQIGLDSATNHLPSTLGEQCKIALENVDKCLAAAGATKKDILQVRHYVVNLLRGGQGQDPERAKQYLEWIGDLRPPTSLLGLESLANEKILYEVEVVCVVENR